MQSAIPTGHTGKVLVFGLGSLLGALPLESVVEISRALPVRAIAGQPDCVLGLAIVRGAPAPVVDLARLVTGTPGQPTRFVSVRADDRRVVLAVDSVVGIRTAGPQDFQALPPLLRDVEAATAEAIGTLDDALFLVLKVSRLLPPEFATGAIEELAS